MLEHVSQAIAATLSANRGFCRPAEIAKHLDPKCIFHPDHARKLALKEIEEKVSCQNDKLGIPFRKEHAMTAMHLAIPYLCRQKLSSGLWLSVLLLLYQMQL